LILGLVFLVLGLTPGMPIPIFLMVHLAHAGGALIVLAALRFLFAPVAGWPVATALAGAIGIAQYFVIAALEPGATQFLRRMYLSWSEMLAYCGGALAIFTAIYPYREWRERREKARWEAIRREDDMQWRR